MGTIVVAAFEEEVNPAAVSQGQAVRLSVVNPVVVNGVTVIEAGAPVMGEVSIAQTPGAIGKPAKIGVTLQYVTAVDGTRIPISGQTVVEGENKQTTSLVVTILCCVLGLIMKGGEASIPAGSQVKATTLADAEISTSAEQK
ncbi:MAG: hypothetical protein D6815_10085 [Candidatus Dadabacteria bacterium]|nr:MAG: hypothetical protein D6815_10085 [Candidatus Dadabacteria bacterium]